MRTPEPLLLLVLWTASCSVLGGGRGRPGVPSEYAPEEVTEAIAGARTELSEGRTRIALDRLIVASETRGLDPAERAEVQELLERTAKLRIEKLTAVGDADELEDLVDEELPGRLAVTAGVRAAELLFKEGERDKAYQLIKRVDESWPHHHERHAAAALLAEVGFSFAEDDGRYLLIAKYRNLAPGVLEYLVLNYPSDPRGDEAYATLAELYEEDERWQLAIEKHEELILWYQASPLATASKARIPHLRLAAIASPEYDRSELERARRELEAWLAEHAGHELEESVLLDLADCTGRIADSDLSIARFYKKVHNSTGAEFHARRALVVAGEGRDESQIAEAETLLAAVLASKGDDTELRPTGNPLEALDDPSPYGADVPLGPIAPEPDPEEGLDGDDVRIELETDE